MESFITRRKLGHVAHQSSLEALHQRYARFAEPNAAMPVVEPNTKVSTKTNAKASAKAKATPTAVPAHNAVTFNAPQLHPVSRRARIAGRKTRNAAVVVLKKTWGTVVFTFDLLAEVFKQAGRVVAVFITPVTWALGNVAMGAWRGIAYTWQFLRPKSDIPPGMIAFAEPITMLEAYSATLTTMAPIALFPSWAFQPITGTLAHDVRKYEVFEEALLADPNSYWANKYMTKLEAQLAEYKTKVAASKSAQDEENGISTKKMTRDARERHMLKHGWVQITPKVEVTSEELDYWVANGMPPHEYARCFPHVLAAQVTIDEYDRFWAVPTKDAPLYTMEEESRVSPSGIPQQRNRRSRASNPTITSLSASTNKELNRLERESTRWNRKKGPERDRLYGQNNAVRSVRENPKVLTDKEVRTKALEALKAEVKPRSSGFTTRDVMQGWNRALRALEAAEAASKSVAAA